MNPYAVLGVKPEDSPHIVRRRYRLLAGKWHPDRNPDNPKEAERRFKEVAEAYRILQSAVYKAQPWTHQQRYNPASHKPKYKRPRKTYHDRLREDVDNPESQAMLVLIELTEGQEDQGFSRYLQFLREGVTSLEECLEDRDFMDCCFLLAEHFEKRKRWAEAVDHYKRVYWRQHHKPIMPFYKLESGDRLMLLINKLADREMDPMKRLKVIMKSLHFARGKADVRRAMGKISDEALKMGNIQVATRVARGMERKGFRIASLKVVKTGVIRAVPA